MIQTLIYFLLSAIILIISGIFLVKSLSKIAKRLGISEFSAAFIIMAFATSIPELFVGISSALAGNPALSLGNIIGANIIDLTLVTGIIVLLSKNIKFEQKKIGKEVYNMLIAILLIIILYTIGKSLSRLDGLILFTFFIFHTYQMLMKRKKYEKKKIKNGKSNINNFYWLVIFLIALIGLFISSNLIVKFATTFTEDFNFPPLMVGLFLISIATTLPEFIFGISAIKLNHQVMAIGDQLGTVIANSTLILGIVAMIHPISTDFLPFLISSIFMFISAFILITFIKSGNKLERYEGISLILIYVLFIIFQLFIK